MLLEQITRKLAAFKRQLQTEKVLAMAEVEKVAQATHKVIVIGVAAPVELHDRMKAFLDKAKNLPGGPKTLKQLALLAITVGLKQLELNGIPSVGFHDPDDVVDKLTALFDPAWDVDVQRTSDSWDIVVPASVTLAENLLIPREVNGVSVRIIRR